ncbi:hypothetical protein B0I37DRAFT_206524 [Chaetomium sp. MPI-CAGE-AT-0009]|nr:hypothetical protein B0I37DRAFT_206524 [Chaetomium sp. MPI-CAGE-AT-0009]
MTSLVKQAAAAAVLLSSSVAAQDITTSQASACATVLTPSYSAPVAAKGWKAQLIATNLTNPRGIKFDSNGGLLVLEARSGLRHLTFNDNGGTCLSVRNSTSVIADDELNHGLELSEDGTTIYVSTAENVDRYSYDADTVTVGNHTRIIANMTNPGVGHVSRTLLLSKKQPDLLLVSRGSAENLDPLAADQSTGVSHIRAFNISNTTTSTLQRPYSYPDDGLLVGWGLRNSVGVAEHPVTGAIWSVENSADEIHRLGEDIHEENPGEELNYHGLLNDTDSPNSLLGRNYGYPTCFAVGNTANFPSQGELTIGSQFSLQNDATANDTDCAQRTVPPRLTFQAHTAPLDIAFLPGNGSRAFISFHGSWNRDHPAGYKLSYVAFATTTTAAGEDGNGNDSNEAGLPLEAADSANSIGDVLSAPDVSRCSERGACFRPVGLAFDAAAQRLFVSSDATGEIWVVMRDGEEEEEGGGNGGGGGPVESTSAAAAMPGVGYRGIGGEGWVVVAVTAVMVAVGALGFMA